MAKKRQAEFAKWMGLILDALRHLGGSGTPQEVSEQIAEAQKISDDKIEGLTASGIPRFHNQVCWARQYLVWEGYIESSKRGVWTLSSIGSKKHLSDEEARQIFLKWVEIFTKRRKVKQQTETGETQPEKLTPHQTNATYVEPHRQTNSYKERLASILRSLSARGFEELCLLLLRENGFESLR